MRIISFNSEEEEVKKIIHNMDIEFEFIEEEAKEVSDEVLTEAVKKFDPFLKYTTPIIMWLIPIFI